jgi:prephenate dehydrogenase
METSPLRLLDNDVSQMLCEQVRISREEEARRFHDNLFNYGEKLNGEHHDLIMGVYHDVPHIFNYANIEYMQNLFSEKKMFKLSTCGMIKYYYEQHIDNTKLQRTHR